MTRQLSQMQNTLLRPGPKRYTGANNREYHTVHTMFFRIPVSLFSRRKNPARDQVSCDKEQGFTLVELLVVLAILGLLIALVAPAMIRQLGSAKHKIAQQSVERLSGVLDLYHLDVGEYPTESQGLAALSDNPGNVSGWNGPYLKDSGGINDPWNRPFQYLNPSQRAKHAFDIISLGADGKQGGDGEDADIINR